MQPASELVQEDARWQICPTKKVWVEERNNQLHLDNKADLKLVDWRDEATELCDISQESVVIASPDIGMREAIKLKQRSGQPILLVENDELIGVLDDSDFYAGLLGKLNHSKAA